MGTASGVQSYTVTAFEWAPRKAASNARKHGIRFADAVAVLEDEQAVTVQDQTAGEERWATVGMDSLGRILLVVYAWRGTRYRIISARCAPQREARQYAEHL